MINFLTRTYGLISWPSKPGDGGDDCLWNGMLCHVGFVCFSKFWSFQNTRVTDDRFGMFYRNPQRALTDGIPPHYFSRDMATGVLLALCGQLTDERYMTSCLWAKYFGCKLRYAPDKRSWITPWMAALTSLVYDSHGYKGLPKLYRLFSVKNKLLQKYVLWETKHCPVKSGLHLKACSVLILRACGEHDLADKIAEICYQRNPEDVFYNLLRNKENTDMTTLKALVAGYKEPTNVWCWGRERFDFLKEQSGIDLIFAVKLAEKYGALQQGEICV